ncbi:MAG: hopanoid biosynthesis-associated transporter HpnN [Sphingomonadales bacterium]|nr:hopanoid biosynthesis-associated transporter HpnN [Sphingomonadales bacterium]
MITARIIRLVEISIRRPLAVLLIGLALVVGALAFTAGHFAMTTDTGALISPDVDWRRNESRIETAFPHLTDAVLVIVDGKTPEIAEAATIRLTARLSTDATHFRLVRRPDGGAFFDREGLLFGSTAEVRAATASLIEAQPLLGPLAADPSLRGVANAVATMLTGVENGATSLDRIHGPMQAMRLSLDRSMQGKPATFSWQQLFAKGGTSVAPLRRLILVQPKLDYGSLEPGDVAVAAISAHAVALGLDAAHGVSVRATGEVPLADEEFASLQENIGFVGFVMAVAMLLTLWLATRSVRVVGGIVLTTVAGLIVTTAVGLFAVGTLNLISVAFIPLFVGLGVDFGIQVSVRFNAERLDGAAVDVALQKAATALAAPLTLAAGAVFLGFGAFLPTDYVGISELGIIAGLGMVIALLLNITLLPALLVVLKPAAPKTEAILPGAAATDRWLVRHRRAILWAFGVSMIGSIALLPVVRFDFNPLHLRNPDGPAMRALADLMHDPLRTPNTINVLAANPEQAAALARRLSALPEVAEAITVDSFVPADQPTKLALIEDAALLLDATVNPFDITPPPTDAETVTALSATAAQLGRVGASQTGPSAVEARALGQTFDRLARAAPAARTRAADLLVTPLNTMLNQVRSSLTAGPVTRASLPPEIAGDWLAKDGRALVQVFPRGDSNDNRVLTRFTRAVRTIAPDASGLPVATQEAARTVAFAFIEAGVLALALVSILLFLVLRNVREVAFTLAPVVLSGFLTLGTCAVIGQQINFANIIAFPLLFGVGVAFHIYFVMAWRGGATDLLQSSLARAVLFSAIATGSAFGSLALSHHPGTASMGMILMISLAWTLVCALIFEPALLGPPRDRHP